MTESGKCESRLIMEEDKTVTHDKLITYVDKLTWIMHIICIWFSPTSPTWRRAVNFAVCSASLSLGFYGMCFEMYMIYKRGITTDVTTSTTLCAIIWTAQAIISGVFMIQWQLSGRFFQYLCETVAYQKGKYIKKSRDKLKSELFRCQSSCCLIYLVL
ncbi:hypothetical protein ANCCAN_07067 [Ancylostoma caninum]|uniref:Uncharacterized protein n=1 Tax=Ancylostoma caninum TaxID=29170 RepID=A0A368GTG1_ANCCA|nr:hypothetical protein ANCCAN_07067 [Ancylostoma caninum]